MTIVCLLHNINPYQPILFPPFFILLLQIEYSIEYIEIVNRSIEMSAQRKLMGSEMLKYIVISITAVSCSGLGCPMGLGKHYENKPAFFHTDFYAYKADTNTTPAATSNLVAQQQPTLDQRRSS